MTARVRVFDRIHLVDSMNGRDFLFLIGQTEHQIVNLHYRSDGRRLVALVASHAAHVWKFDAIRAELESRSLGWQTGARIAAEALGNAKSDSALRLAIASHRSVGSNPFDELRQLFQHWLSSRSLLEQRANAVHQHFFDLRCRIR